MLIVVIALDSDIFFLNFMRSETLYTRIKVRVKMQSIMCPPAVAPLETLLPRVCMSGCACAAESKKKIDISRFALRIQIVIISRCDFDMDAIMLIVVIALDSEF